MSFKKICLCLLALLLVWVVDPVRISHFSLKAEVKVSAGSGLVQRCLSAKMVNKFTPSIIVLFNYTFRKVFISFASAKVPPFLDSSEFSEGSEILPHLQVWT